MEKTYKVLIISTFIISVFSLGKYFYKVWPRYEIRESIINSNVSIYDLSTCVLMSLDKQNLSCFCEKTQKIAEPKVPLKKGEIYISQITGYTETCYIKEKIKIN